MPSEWVILKGGDFALPYTDKDGKPKRYPTREAAEQARRPGDVAVEYGEWEEFVQYDGLTAEMFGYDGDHWD